jgi:hypothetical protein
MATDSLPAAGSPEEEPSRYAELVVQLGPAQQWGSARGKVPPEHTHHFITTFGIVTSVAAGIAGAVLTLRIAAGLTGPAYAELGLAFVAALLIAMRRSADRAAWRESAGPRAREPARGSSGMRKAFPLQPGTGRPKAPRTVRQKNTTA